MYCEKCGALNEEGSRFCIKCGSPLPVMDIKVEKPEKPATPAKPAATTNPKLAEQAAPKTEEPKQAAPKVETRPQGQPQASKQQVPPQDQSQAQQQAAGQQPNFSEQFQGVQDQVTSGFHQFQNIVTGNTFKNYLTEGYKNPLEAVRIGTEGAMLKEGLIIYFAKDILCALFIMLKDLGHFPMMLIALLTIDAIELFISLGIGKAFGGKASLAQWFGAMGGGTILTGTLTVAGYLFINMNLAVISGILMALSTLISIVVMVKTFEISMDLHENKLIYSIVVTLVLVVIAMMIVGMAFGAYFVQSQIGAIQSMVDNFM